MTTEVNPADDANHLDAQRRPEIFENMAPDTQRFQVDYAVVTDVQLRGSCILEACCLRVNEADKGSRPQLTIRYRYQFHPAGVADQFAALASLFAGRRFEWENAADAVARRAATGQDVTASNPVDPYLYGGTVDLDELSSWYKRLLGLTPDAQWHVQFGAYMYQLAVLTIEARPDVAFLNLVSAIEAVSGAYRLSPKPTLPDVDGKLAKLVSEVDSQDLKRRLTAAILGRERFLRRRFVAFVCDHVNHDELWPLVEPQNFGGQARKLLRRLVENIYDERSLVLHEGRPFPNSIRWPYCHPPCNHGDPSVERAVAAFWSRRGTVPPVAFLERLVHHVLRQYVLRVANVGQRLATGPEHGQGAA